MEHQRPDMDAGPSCKNRVMRWFALPVIALVGALAVGSCGDDGRASQGPAGTTHSKGSTPPARTAASGVRLAKVGDFTNPLYVTAPPGDTKRVFVVEQGGRIWVLVNGKRVRQPFLNIADRIVSGGEQGLLSMAFAPDYARTGRFYVDFTDRNGDSRIEEFRRSKRSANRADSSSARQILFVDQPYPNHNGGLALFGPDKLLYVGFGDGGAGGDPQNRAQNLNSLLGKILRIDPRRSGVKSYRSPASNPFVGKAGRNEIYAYGLRNPWRFSFDRKTGDLYIGDVGQDRFEEIDFERKGAARGRNFGWSCFEGSRAYDTSRSCPGAVPPLLDYGRSHGECSVTGGVVVRDPSLPALAGRYVYGDYCRGQLLSLRVSGGRAVDLGSLDLHVSGLSSFGEDARGHIYVTSLAGPVYRLVAK
jgi:glucose/arabinose dehydrogenase